MNWVKLKRKLKLFLNYRKYISLMSSFSQHLCIHIRVSFIKLCYLFNFITTLHLLLNYSCKSDRKRREHTKNNNKESSQGCAVGGGTGIRDGISTHHLWWQHMKCLHSQTHTQTLTQSHTFCFMAAKQTDISLHNRESQYIYSGYEVRAFGADKFYEAQWEDLENPSMNSM